jgi:hypothetical protein
LIDFAIVIGNSQCCHELAAFIEPHTHAIKGTFDLHGVVQKVSIDRISAIGDTCRQIFTVT